jgi:hypothetical protein
LRRRPVSDIALAVLVKVVLDRIAHDRPALSAAPGRRFPALADPARTPRERGRSRPLLLFTFASLGVALVLMLVFHAPVTRVFGVAALFAFIVSGVFLIADPVLLGPEDDNEPLTDRGRG